MSNVTRENVEVLAAQLTPQDQLQLMAKISDRLSQQLARGTLKPDEAKRREYSEQIEAFLKMADENAAECIGPVDSAEDIREIRNERASRL